MMSLAARELRRRHWSGDTETPLPPAAEPPLARLLQQLLCAWFPHGVRP